MGATAHKVGTPTLSGVAISDEDRAKIRARRERLGMSLRELEKESGINRATIASIESGDRNVRSASVRAITAALDRIEGEIRGPYDDDDKGVVTFRLQGNFGVDVTLAGPVSNLDELEASVTRLLRTMGDPSAKRPNPEEG
jgi:transcriptional regulator with XRE-family HTH domain